MSSHAKTSHIDMCRMRWHEHKNSCGQCFNYVHRRGHDLSLCEQGSVLYDKYRHAISAHPDLENVVGEAV